jgi:membrane protease YdiL (CAAX protease family)
LGIFSGEDAKMNKKYIIISSLTACIILYFVEQVLGVNYIVKTLSKALLFTAIPFFYIKYVKRSTLKEFLNLKRTDRKHLRLGLLFGTLSFIIVLGAYYVFKGAINLQAIAGELEDKLKITPLSFIFVGGYITFGNSFLEEFFFRGFIFLNLYEAKSRKTAYIYSSLLFGLYHISIFKTWFNFWLIGLAMIGLVGIGFIFDWLDTKSANFINSWMVHILADTAVILIGFRMFGLI